MCMCCLRRRCLHEIQAVASLPEHPNVVGQYRAWQQGGHFYIQMDLCEGGSLAQLLRQVRVSSQSLIDAAIRSDVNPTGWRNAVSGSPINNCG